MLPGIYCFDRGGYWKIHLPAVHGTSALMACFEEPGGFSIRMRNASRAMLCRISVLAFFGLLASLGIVVPLFPKPELQVFGMRICIEHQSQRSRPRLTGNNKMR